MHAVVENDGYDNSRTCRLLLTYHAERFIAKGVEDDSNKERVAVHSSQFRS